MILLVLAAGGVYAALLLATFILEREFFFVLNTNQHIFTTALTVLVVPTIATWLTAEIIGATRRTRILDRRLERGGARLAAGLGAGFLGVIAGTFALILLDRSLPDALLTGAASAIATAIILLPLPRQRPFTCPNCAYDLSGASPASGGLCTECGFVLMWPKHEPERLPFRLGPCDDAQLSASQPPSAASLQASFPQPGCP